MNNSNNNRGQILILVAISMVVLISFAALAIDIAYFYHTKNQLQGATDAAALAGAAFLTCEKYDGSNTVQTAARNTAHYYALKNTASGQNVQTELNTGNNINGDIIVGNWDGTTFLPTPSIGVRINAMRVVARRTKEPAVANVSVGDNPVSTFFGKIFNILQVNIKAEATATGCNLNLSPIAVNEYWMGDDGTHGGGGNPTCTNPAKSDPRTNGANRRKPYHRNNVYPNSFVRPPTGSPYGNVRDFSLIPIRDCTNSNNATNDISTSITANGPLNADCTTLGTYGCDGRPSLRAGRVFAIAGASASANAGNMWSLVNLDGRTNSSSNDASPWYQVSGNTLATADWQSVQPTKDDIAGLIETGTYKNILPTSVTEIYQPNYLTVNEYLSSEPYASLSFYNGFGNLGYIMDHFTNNNYADGRYNLGKTIIVTVYDGIVGGGGNNKRTTIVGFARITIFAYGNSLTLNGTSPQVNPGNNKSMYGYVASVADSLKQDPYDLYKEGQGRTFLVK